MLNLKLAATTLATFAVFGFAAGNAAATATVGSTTGKNTSVRTTAEDRFR